MHPQLLLHDAIASGWAKDAHAFSVLLKWAKNDADAQIRIAALQAIRAGWAQTEQGMNFLKDRAAVDPDPEVRIAGLEKISEVIRQNLFIAMPGDLERQNNALKFLQERAISEPHLGVRETAVQTLALIEWWIPQIYGMEANFTEFYVDRAQNDPEVRIRLLALNAISKLGRGFGGEHPQGPLLSENLPFLKHEATSNPDSRNRVLAIESIGSAWNDEGILPLLMNRAESDSDPRVRSAALKAIFYRSFSDKVPRDLLAFVERRAEEEPDLPTREFAQVALRSLQANEGRSTD